MILKRLVSRLLGRQGGSESTDRLDAALESLEAQVREASPGYETQFLNRAGNLCVEAGQPARALGYMGRAIDAYLESGRFNAAEVLCRKVLEISPEAVRPRCTLAWIAIGKGFPDQSREAITEYVDAAEAGGQQELAARQLTMMAEAADNLELRRCIAEHLLSLEEAERADQVFGMVFKEQNDVLERAASQQGKLWAKLLTAALMGPAELRGNSSAAADDDADALPSLSRDTP
jgi:tetratricopeptide (TPR) repeat protein